MSRLSDTLVEMLLGVDMATKLNITPHMWERVKKDDAYIKPWLMRYVIDKFNINPVYIHTGVGNPLLNKEACQPLPPSKNSK